ncbi:hypothetical protein [Anoxynatronum sibiricum]|uniref:Uncharacterized protein n=1 Tax=Anoxynatronum sibiricum TaxID=210623 RepID=A0ABU9VVA8_9CLOT
MSHILNLFESHFTEVLWKDVSNQQKPHEAIELSLDSEKAHRELMWRPVWSLEKTVFYTASWYHSFLQKGEVRTDDQLERYIQDAVGAGMTWVKD